MKLIKLYFYFWVKFHIFLDISKKKFILNDSTL